MERQKHGFNFEEAVKEILGYADETKSYTAAFDVGEDISVKFIKESSTVDMGSIVRIFEHLENPGWKMILGRHIDKVCTQVIELEFTTEVCEKLKGSLTLEDVKSFDATVKSFPVGEHEKARKYAKEWKSKNKLKFGLLTPQPKIDSKSQRRVQCGINMTNLKKLFELTHSAKFDSLIGENFGS